MAHDTRQTAGKRFLDEVARFLGTGAYVGYAPWASGTFGTLPAVAAAYPLAGLAVNSATAYLAALVLSAAVAVWAAGRCQELFATHDPGKVVCDEIVGFFVAMAFLPVDLPHLTAGFLFFRLFDITKPGPVRRAEALPGGLGVVADDLLAGLLANVCVRFGAALW